MFAKLGCGGVREDVSAVPSFLRALWYDPVRASCSRDVLGPAIMDWGRKELAEQGRNPTLSSDATEGARLELLSAAR